MDIFAPDRRFTVADLLAMPELDRYELYNGIPVRMSDGHAMELPEGVRYTMEEFLAMPENGIFELLRGKLRKLPRPTPWHQSVLLSFSCQLNEDHLSRPAIGLGLPYFVMPFAVPDTPFDQIDTLLEPDFILVTERAKVTDSGCMGAPDLVLEIVTPGAEDFDFGEKLDLYEAAGVREYWIVQPDQQVLTVCLLENGKFRRQVYHSGKVPVAIFPPLEVDLDIGFRAPRV